MQHETSFLANANRYLFDNMLLQLGYKQLDSEQDASYYGNWFQPKLLKLVTFAEGDLDVITYDSTEEFIGHVLAKKELLGYMHLDDWEQGWCVPIERSELEVYMSYERDDAIV